MLEALSPGPHEPEKPADRSDEETKNKRLAMSGPHRYLQFPDFFKP